MGGDDCQASGRGRGSVRGAAGREIARGRVAGPDERAFHGARAHLEVKRNDWMAQGKPLDDLLDEAERCQARAREAGIRSFVASFANLRTDMLLMLGRPADAIPLMTGYETSSFPLRGAEAAWTRESAPDRAILVDLLTPLAIAHSMLGDDAAASDVVGAAIAEIERDRYNISSPYLQSSFFSTRSKLYAVGVWSAYKLQDYRGRCSNWMELSKARSLAAMRTRTPVPALDRSELNAAFRAVSAEIDRNPNDPELGEHRRRRLWDLLAIERLSAHDREPAAFSLAGVVHAALDPDEALVYYYWLSHNTFLVAAIDAASVVVERVVVKEPERGRLDALVHALSTLTRFNGNLDAAIAQFSTTLHAGRGPGLRRRETAACCSRPHRSLHQLPFHALTWTGRPPDRALCDPATCRILERPVGRG